MRCSSDENATAMSANVRHAASCVDDVCNNDSIRLMYLEECMLFYLLAKFHDHAISGYGIK